jgi:hypothetical protein
MIAPTLKGWQSTEKSVRSSPGDGFHNRDQESVQRTCSQWRTLNIFCRYIEIVSKHRQQNGQDHDEPGKCRAALSLLSGACIGATAHGTTALPRKLACTHGRAATLQHVLSAREIGMVGVNAGMAKR